MKIYENDRQYGMNENIQRSIAGVGPKLFLISELLSFPIIVVACLTYVNNPLV